MRVIEVGDYLLRPEVARVQKRPRFHELRPCPGRLHAPAVAEPLLRGELERVVPGVPDRQGDVDVEEVRVWPQELAAPNSLVTQSCACEIGETEERAVDLKTQVVNRRLVADRKFRKVLRRDRVQVAGGR